MKKKASAWTKEVKKAMIDRDLDLRALCSAIGGYTREYISAVVNQRVYSPDVINKINTYLQIDEYTEE